MQHQLGLVAILVRDYDEAIEFYTKKLKFILTEDTVQTPEKRWVTLRPRGQTSGCSLLLAKASNEEQMQFVGRQTGGRVFLFLYTDDFWRDYRQYQDAGIRFVRSPVTEQWGTVAVFSDLYGNLWDLIEPIGS